MSNIFGNHHPLIFAAYKGHLEICRHAIGKLGGKNPAKKDGETPLHMADPTCS